MKKLQYTTNDPSATTDYLAADNTWKTIPGGGGGSGIPHGNTSGTDTYTTTISGVTAYNDADAFLIRFVNGNTTSATLNINSLGAIPLYRNNDGALIGGDIIDGAEMLCVYNSTTNRFQLIGTAPNTLLSYVTNAESTTITKGQAVYAFGGQGDRLKVKLANNTTDATSAQTIGIVLSTSIAANQKGLIIMQGQIDGLNLFPTSTWSDGDAVYLGSTAGSFSHTKPLAPNHLVYLGFVTTASNGSAGRMYVRVQNGYEMNEIHDVKITSLANNDILKYNSSNDLWENSNVLSTKQDTITGAATTITSSNLTVSRALVSDGSGKVAVSSVTDTEISYLSGVSSSIQTQLNSKIGSSFSFINQNHAGTTITASTTSYGGWTSLTTFAVLAQEFTRNTIIPLAGAIKNWAINVGAQPASGSLVFTLRVNSVDTAMTITVAAGSASNKYYNTGSSISVAQGDLISFKVVNNATSASGTIVTNSIMYEV
jgi:hypothetical protein